MATTYSDAVAKHGSYRKAAVAMGIKRTTFLDRWHKEKASAAFGQKTSNVARTNKITKDNVQRYIFTCAVREAPVHADFLKNLQTYADYLGAELIIGPLTSTSRQRFSELDPAEFDAALHGLLSDDPLIIGDRVRWSPELNLTPTCVKPLQGLQTFTKGMWGIFPHTKVCLESVATHKDRPAKINVTTGSVTHAHYSPTKAGFRAQFDHVYGAAIVEVTTNGSWVRHLTPTNDADGSFYDLDKLVKKGEVKQHKGVDALIYGDIHVEKLDQECSMATWAYNASAPGLATFNGVTLVGLLKPKCQVFHDLMDMTAINYHEAKNLFKRYENYLGVEGSLEFGLTDAYRFLHHVAPCARENYVVDSNHDHFLDRWLLELDPDKTGDLRNAMAYYTLKVDILKAIQEGKEVSVLERALRVCVPPDDKLLAKVRFLLPDESMERMGIELGWHGHRGSNGSRGSRGSFKFVTEKSTTAHLHSAYIDSGSHIVGTASKLDLGYNQGASSWSHTHGVVYPNGTRALLTMSDGVFYPGQGEIVYARP